ncbi:MAG: hypothetical protein AABX85_01705 [Nanoarchaeota archaeon]
MEELLKEDTIRDAFARAKQDIFELREQFSNILYEMEEIKQTLDELIQQNLVNQTSNQTDNVENQSNSQQTPPFPTDDWHYKRLKPHIYSISTGNKGVPTNRQTDSQTNQHSTISPGIDEIDRVSELLESLDTIKKDLRSKFKHLTKQEMLVFSTLYQLEEEGLSVDYPLIARKLALSESSIRDYVQRIINKGIPIQKTKENNKKIILSLSQDFKKIASLQTILKLREL